MQVPMPLVPSASSDHTPPSHVPQCLNWSASVDCRDDRLQHLCHYTRGWRIVPAAQLYRGTPAHPAHRRSTRKRLSQALKFAARQDPRRFSRRGINTVRFRAPLPGGRYFVVGRQRWVPLRNRKYPLDMSSGGVGMPQWLRLSVVGRCGWRAWSSLLVRRRGRNISAHLRYLFIL
jgi:hypothetical protein